MTTAHVRDRARAASAALTAAIDDRRSSLAAIELAYARLAIATVRSPASCDVAATAHARCSGIVCVRWCPVCGTIVRRCIAHGGIRRAIADIDVHGCTGPVETGAALAIQDEVPEWTEVLNAGRPEELPKKVGKRW